MERATGVLGIEWNRVWHREQLLGVAHERARFVLGLEGFDRARVRIEQGLRQALAAQPLIPEWQHAAVRSTIATAIGELDQRRAHAESLDPQSDITLGEAGKAVDAAVLEAHRRYQPRVQYTCGE